MQPKLNRDILFVLLSLFVQVPLAVFLGHFYDDRIFMATGYLVSSGVNPYLSYNFMNIFQPYILISIIVLAIIMAVLILIKRKTLKPLWEDTPKNSKFMFFTGIMFLSDVTIKALFL